MYESLKGRLYVADGLLAASGTRERSQTRSLCAAPVGTELDGTELDGRKCEDGGWWMDGGTHYIKNDTVFGSESNFNLKSSINTPPTP
jgi:hypothetical protein